MNKSTSTLNWIDDQHTAALENLRVWCDINSHTFNTPGVDAVRLEIAKSFEVFGEKISYPKLKPYEKINDRGEKENFSLADGLYLKKRPDAPVQAICVIHMDTVFSKDHPFQKCEEVDKNTLRGPGVTDAKGGIAVMLLALQAFEQYEHKDKLGWQIFLNTDEEIGSPGSSELLAQYAKDAQVALVYEPALPDGMLVSERKGSGNFTLVVRGKAAHAGRDFHEGRNAIHALSGCILELGKLTGAKDELTVNMGKITGGEANNIVADLAVLHFNVRLKRGEDQKFAEDSIHDIIRRMSEEHGVKIDLHGSFQAPPRVWTKDAERLFEMTKAAGVEIGMNVQWRPSGGVCDGNRLSACGLTTIDSLGVKGGNLHNDQEYLCIDSLIERAKLSYSLLTKLADGVQA